MTEFALPIAVEGSVTAPTGTFVMTVPSAESVVYHDVGGVNVLEIPEYGYAVADGVNPLRYVVEGTVYNAGGVAPTVGPTATPDSGVRATVVGTYTGQPGNNQTLLIGIPGLQFTVTWVTTITTHGLGSSSAPAIQCKIGASADASYLNLKNLINQAGTLGTDYWYDKDYGGWNLDPRPDSPTAIGFNQKYYVECSAQDTGAGTVTMRFTLYGTIGNTCVSTEPVDVDNFTWATTAFTGGVDGVGPGPSEGTIRYFYTWFCSATGCETGRSPITTLRQIANTKVALSVLTASADATFDFTNIYRTTNTGVDFFQLGSIARTGSVFTDDLTDQSLLVVSQGIPWNDLLYRYYSEGMPPRGRALALWKGAVWSLGARLHADYTRGTVAVTVDSASVTFSIQGISTNMVGRTFQVDATPQEYTIISVNETTKVVVLDRVYEGTTNGTATFRVKDTYNAKRLRRCVPFKYHQWPVEESPGEIETDDAEGGTALLATKGVLFAFSRTSIVAVTGEDLDSWEMNKISAGVGCVAPNMVVEVEGGGMFLASDGFYALSPDGGVVCISSPKAAKRQLATGIDGTVARIAWADIESGYAEYDRTERVVIFGLPLDGATTPNYELVLDLQNGTWTLNKRAEWTSLAQITLPGGGQALLAGDREGWLWHANIGESDGFYGTEAVQTLTGAQTVRVLTVTGTPYSTSEGGKPVIILYANGSTVAYGKVASSTTSALTLAEDLATAPAAGDQIILGGIAWQAKSGFTTGGEEYLSKTLRAVTLRHAPTTRGDYHFSFAVNSGSYQLCPVGTSIGLLTEKDGKVRHMTQWPGDTHSINIRGFKPGGRAILRGGVFDFVTRSSGRV